MQKRPESEVRRLIRARECTLSGAFECSLRANFQRRMHRDQCAGGLRAKAFPSLSQFRVVITGVRYPIVPLLLGYIERAGGALFVVRNNRYRWLSIWPRLCASTFPFQIFELPDQYTDSKQCFLIVFKRVSISKIVNEEEPRSFVRSSASDCLHARSLVGTYHVQL